MSESELASRARFDLLSLVDPGFMTRVGVHYGLFFGAIRGQATMEQMSGLMEKGLLTLRGMYGCFAMTELGYATCCRALCGTTARPRCSLAGMHGWGLGLATAPMCPAWRRRPRSTARRTSL